MEYLETIEELEALYSSPSKASLVKVAKRMTPTYRKWIMASKFCVLSTIGPEGTDGSPRGDDGPVVLELDERHIALPDWRGNNRIDSLRNIIRDPRVSLMFMVPHVDIVVRLNGRARLTVDEALRQRFARAQGEKLPGLVTVVQIDEIYAQCAKSIMRSGLWRADHTPPDIPSLGEMLKEQSSGEFDGEAFDRDWPSKAAQTLW
ncbi:pyridoxamine 5'-phosphate oxidase family protein [Aliiroseovarius crassostreae]|uniref:Pyridoxamine 5'-phosphate oxidase family protein n=1 Tax=Aliiroseovarius crassostreae TaxID=154981 RepID=A0A9Q9LYU1_9RHOB|nr:pyridoxamine 5'-phosphate oxidase family protein [Aliiroseovarius crassostreae]UWP91792.1 pyridoxamine 5'-phosphate oxidase family protein [Aliiroseovarius crassostreae]UWP94939.1 pyridoxamine 5'-phosphate oxidase family protein [Aliiroseovarius crassostreae]